MRATSSTAVMIIEPDERLLKSIGGLFSEKGYDVGLFLSETEGLKDLAGTEYDLVIARMELKNGAGFDLLDEVKKARPECLFIALTNEITSQSLIHQAMRAGASDLLFDPITPRIALEAAESALNLYRDQIRARRMYCCLKREEREFSFPSDESAIGPVVDLMVENLPRVGLCSRTEARLVAMALTEAVSNAIYHGNLEINPSDKISMGKGRFQDEVYKRVCDDKYKGRRVKIHYILTPAEARYTIADDGAGFDHANWKPEETKPDSVKGRGLLLLYKLMDEVIFNEKGNQVTLIKRASLKNHP